MPAACSVAIARIALVAAREGWCRQFTEAGDELFWGDDRLEAALDHAAARG